MAPLLASGVGSMAFSISPNGENIAGWYLPAFQTGLENSEAFVLRRDGLNLLGRLTGGRGRSAAFGVSDDGKDVVGWSQNSSNMAAFRWSVDTGMENLGSLQDPQFLSYYSMAVSADGKVIVGNASRSPRGIPEPTPGWGPWQGAEPRGFVSDDDEGFIWDRANGMRRLRPIIEKLAGVSLAEWRGLAATAMAQSERGISIVGHGKRRWLFQATLSELAIPRPVLSEIRWLPGLSFTITGTLGSSYRIESTPEVNLGQWTAVGTVTLTNSQQRWTETSVPRPDRRFYRVVEMSQP